VVTGPRIINKAVKAEMKKVLTEIQNGKFAKNWIKESKTGRKKYHKLLKDGAKHPIERTGARLRGLMPWIGKKNLGGAQAAY
jgi:ketol-acid reductoisomerase